MTLAFEAMKLARKVKTSSRTECTPIQIAAEELSETKRCSRCALTLDFSRFNKSSSGRHGLHNHCRECQSIVRRENYLSNRNAAIEAARVARASGKYKIAWKLRYDTDATFKARILQANRERRKNSGARMKAKIAKRKNEIANPAAKIARNLRVRMRKTLLGISKSASTISLLGCSAAEFARHLESHFKPGMSWANYGYFGWHIDHAIPCAAFNLTDPIQQKACFHFTNMRPEWRFENQSKGKRLLLDVLTKADVRLLAIAREQIGGAA